MRVLKPEVAEERKRTLLRWVIHRFIKTSAPVSSKTIAEEGPMKLSPASIRNVLKELEDEGLLVQEHASSGRVPTDKGYRVYVNDLVELQRLAADDKQRIEAEYKRRVAELDELMVHTSRMLSHMSRSAGFALSPAVTDQPVQRVELLPLGPRHALALLVTQSGLIRHFPLELAGAVDPERLQLLSRFLSGHVQGLTLREVRESLYSQIEKAEREFRDLGALARQLLGTVSQAAGPEELYVEGAASLAALPASDPTEMRSVLAVVEDRKRLARILQEEFEEQLRHADEKGVQVRIGGENRPELRSLSVVTTTYGAGDKLVGLLGVIGPKHMEYAKMMSLVRFVGTVVSETLSRWEEIYGDDKGRKAGRK